VEKGLGDCRLFSVNPIAGLGATAREKGRQGYKAMMEETSTTEYARYSFYEEAEVDGRAVYRYGLEDVESE
jgi:hypothetical protein